MLEEVFATSSRNSKHHSWRGGRGGSLDFMVKRIAATVTPKTKIVAFES